jgi:hypothetical protein
MSPRSRLPSKENQTGETPQAKLLLLSRGSRILLWVVFSISILATAIAMTFAALRWNYAFSHYGPAVVWQWSMPGIVAGLIFSLVWLTALTIWIIRRNQTGFVHSGGITLQRGERRVHYPWENLCDLELSIVRYGLPFWQWGSQSSASLSTQRGKRLQFKGRIRDLEAFTNTIKHYLYPRRLHEYRQALEHKQTIEFGSLQCSPDGLSYRRQHIPWDKIVTVNLEGGHLNLSIQKERGVETLRIPANKIVNPDLCAQLIKNIEY